MRYCEILQNGENRDCTKEALGGKLSQRNCEMAITMAHFLVHRAAHPGGCDKDLKLKGATVGRKSIHSTSEGDKQSITQSIDLH